MQIRNRKQKHDANAAKQDEDDTTSRGSANERSRGARKRKAIAASKAEKQKVEQERDELREALDILEAHLGRGEAFCVWGCVVAGLTWGLGGWAGVMFSLCMGIGGRNLVGG